MDGLVEPRVRRVVADTLGVDEARLQPGVSLRDDLAAESLDTVELCFALEEEFGLDLPRGLPGWVRTWTQLVAYVEDAIPDRPSIALVEIAPAGTSRRIVRSESLTPYGVESLIEDALRHGAGTSLSIRIDGRDETGLALLQRALRRLADRGLIVHLSTLGMPGHPHAA